jgi:single-strand DNA-binding protein
LRSGTCARGRKVYLEGKLQTRKWQDQSGADRYSTEIVLQGFNAVLVLLDGKSGEQPQQQPRGSAESDLDDNVPF